MGVREILNKIPFAWCMIPRFFVQLCFQSVNGKLIIILILFDVHKQKSSIGFKRQK